ncbi:aldehyde dehydrogenase family protein [Nocardia sp. BSTN01]|uniref:aldehyde dehydrogenase family protein n=1 Tax=Nocardia sp. BSTN01 TaxID=2783665 RepID=UPI00188F2482|nr:aldehyde dehydrogenase family protein [Nocardia sp. BSTN01]MBF4997284.1 aldehyde dehydrogenase family protein [Nocardia sp. BSTN01]
MTAAAQGRVVTGEARLLVDGALVDSAAGAMYPNLDPATEETLGLVADGAVEDAHTAVTAARRAFERGGWADDPEFRARCLRQLHRALSENSQLFRRIDTAEAGRPFAATAGSIDAYLPEIDWYAEQAEQYPWEQPRGDSESHGARHRRSVHREPIGVTAAITTWNCGFFLNLTKMCAALAAGNTVVLKPAPETPWQATTLGRLIVERTEIPPGVVNIVTGTSPAVARELTTHRDVDLVTFTGSTDVGRKIMAQAAPTLKRLTLELGGKSAAIVMPDADLDFAVALVTRILCTNAGQTCAAATRLLLPKSRYAEGVEAATSALAAIHPGDPWDPATGQGPQISAAQHKRVLDYLEVGRAEGLRLTTGGKRPPHLDRGWFVEPTVFADVPPQSRLFREEIFGPVLVVTPYDDSAGRVDEAIRLANDSEYGLHASVFGTDIERATTVARQLRVGSVSVNGANFFGVDVPFGGYKQSGIGRERGVEGFEEFLETKTIAVPAPPSA